MQFRWDKGGNKVRYGFSHLISHLSVYSARVEASIKIAQRNIGVRSRAYKRCIVKHAHYRVRKQASTHHPPPPTSRWESISRGMVSRHAHTITETRGNAQTQQQSRDRKSIA